MRVGRSAAASARSSTRLNDSTLSSEAARAPYCSAKAAFGSGSRHPDRIRADEAPAQPVERRGVAVEERGEERILRHRLGRRQAPAEELDQLAERGDEGDRPADAPRVEVVDDQVAAEALVVALEVVAQRREEHREVARLRAAK